MDWGDPLAVGLGTFMGVLSGICVDVGVKCWFDRRDRRRQFGNIYFELDFIRMKQGEYLEKLERYVERVEGGNLRPTSMYFDMGRIMAPSFHNMHRKGKLYACLRQEDLNVIMGVASKLTTGYEDYFNKEVRRILDKGDQSVALSRLNSWITDFRKDREAVDQVMERIERYTPRRMRNNGRSCSLG